ncbi:MAG: hypothetical protein R3E39_26390 [Anaerolineae bacterium]
MYPPNFPNHAPSAFPRRLRKARLPTPPSTDHSESDCQRPHLVVVVGGKPQPLAVGAGAAADPGVPGPPARSVWAVGLRLDGAAKRGTAILCVVSRLAKIRNFTYSSKSDNLNTRGV